MFFYLHSFVNFEEEYNNEYYKYWKISKW
jgi:hypothetical protein